MNANSINQTGSNSSQPKDTASKGSLAQCSRDVFDKIWKRSYMFYLYSNRLLKSVLAGNNDDSVGYAIVSPEGCLLKLIGSSSFLAWANNRGIVSGSMWCISNVESNPISISFQNHKPCAMSNNGAISSHLSDVFISFAPCFINHPDDNFREKCLGGLAAIGPSISITAQYLLLLDSLIREIGIHISIALEQTLWKSDISGVLAIDLTLDSYKILYYNQKIFNVIADLPKEIRYKRANEIFDPLPKNSEFWDIIYSKKSVKEVHMLISILGKTRQMILSSQYSCQNYLGYSTITLWINSDQQISSYISKRLGNYASLSFDDIVGADPAFVKVKYQIQQAAMNDSNILIVGESGCGKDIFAQAIHNGSRRNKQPYIAINCAAIPRELIASELFGYEYGAFSGSRRGGHRGKFELANGGTLFLDEIGDMPLDLQPVLLRAIEERHFLKLGGTIPIDVDIRIICATNANLMQKIQSKLFRADLYYRISTMTFWLPPLRDRKEDIPILAQVFLESICQRLSIPRKQLSNRAIDLLKNLPLYGNVRELQNLMESIAQLYPEQLLRAEHIQECLSIQGKAFLLEPEVPERKIIAAKDKMPEAELMHSDTDPGGIIFRGRYISRTQIMQALQEVHFNKSKAAALMGTSRRTFYKWLEILDIR